MMRRMTALLAVSFAVVAAGSVRGEDAPRSAAFEEYARAEAFDADAVWHEQVGRDEIRMSYFLHGNPQISMRCVADLAAYRVTTFREVHDFATQSQKTRELSHARVLTMQKLLKQLVPPEKKPKLENLLIVSFVDDGNCVIRLFDQTQPPQTITQLYDLTGAYLAAAVGDAEGDESGIERQTSDWGPAVHGLRMRITVPAEIETGMPLHAKLEIRPTKAPLDPDMTRLNPFMSDDFLELSLTDPRTEQSWTVKPYDPTAGMPPPFDNGEAAVALDGAKLEPWGVWFPLARVYAELKPGEYTVRVRFKFPETPTRYWHRTREAWDAARFWHGTLVSAPVRLIVLAEPLRTKTFTVPTKLRLRKDLVRLHADDAEETAVPVVYFDKRDAEEVKVPVRNGHFLSTWVYFDGEPVSLGGTPLTPDSPNAIDAWYDYKGGDKKVSYTFEVFETADQPEHLWMPRPGSGGYKVLWKKTFQVSFSEDEIRRVISR